ncbi:MAG: cyclic nucleotide-binding domain-containing protein [Myxococcota bacterium]
MDLAFFRQHSLTRGLSSAQIQMLTSRLTELRLNAGDALLVEGAESRGLFLVKEGTVRVTKAGQELVTLTAPTVLGELELISHDVSSAQVEATDEVIAYLLPRDAFDSMIDSGDPVVSKMMRNIARVVIKRLTETNTRLVSLMDDRMKTDP